MSILRESPIKMGFDARLEQLSRGYKNLTRVCIRNFEQFTKTECEGKNAQELFEYLKAMPEDKRESMLYHVFQSWINRLSETKDPSTVKNYFGVLKKLARHYGFKISNDDVKDNLTFAKKIKERKYVLTLDDIHMILKSSIWRKRGFYLFLLSSGMRPKEALSIRKKDVKMLPNGRFVITIPAHATKLKVERESFVTREVYPYLAQAIKSINDDDLIWTTQKNADYAVINADTAFRRLCDRIGMVEKYESVNRRKLNLYCFRGFFYAKASRKHGDEYAHKMIGHLGYLPVYDRKTLDERLEMYEEFETELITDQTEKLKGEITELKAKEIEIENLKEEFKKDHETVMKLAEANELFEYYIAKLRGNSTQEDDKKFNERYNEYIKSIPKEEEPEWIRSPEIQKTLKEITSEMMGS